MKGACWQPDGALISIDLDVCRARAYVRRLVTSANQVYDMYNTLILDRYFPISVSRCKLAKCFRGSGLRYLEACPYDSSCHYYHRMWLANVVLHLASSFLHHCLALEASIPSASRCTTRHSSCSTSLHDAVTLCISASAQHCESLSLSLQNVLDSHPLFPRVETILKSLNRITHHTT